MLEVQKSRARLERERAGKTREEIAAEARCSISSIVNVECGRRCRNELAGRIAAALGITVDQLFEVIVFEAVQ